MITGISGSGGSYLAEYFLKNQPSVSVHGISRWHSTSTDYNLRGAGGKAQVHECDLMDLSAVVRTLKDVQPDVIFHLASTANVRVGFINPIAVLQNNIIGTANLLEGIRLVGNDPMVQLCSTSEVYGQVDPKNVPITEECPIHPSSPYAVSKTAQDLLGYTYFRSYGMKIIRTRMFSYLNPRRSDLFATSFALQIARIEAGVQSELLHGNLDSIRTLIDVRDAMEAYWIAAKKGVAGEVYNIGGTNSIGVGDFLQLLKRKSKVEIRSRVDENLLRPSDVTLQIPSVEKFINLTGWKPKYSLEESVEFLLDHCREQVARELRIKGLTAAA